MTDLTLAHDLVLLSLDPETGARRRRQQLALGVGGALLTELALAGRLGPMGEVGLAHRLGLASRKVAVLDPTPTGRARADDLLARIVADTPHSAQRWVRRARRGALSWLLDDLVTAELVRRDERRVLGITTRRYPQLGGARRDALLGAMRAVLHDGIGASDPRTVALAHLAVSTQLHRLVFPGQYRGDLVKRLSSIDRVAWTSRATRQAINGEQAAAAG